MLRFSSQPENPPVHRTIPQLLSLGGVSAERVESCAAEIALQETTEFIADKLAWDPLWQWIHEERRAGRNVDNVGALVKARAFDIVVDYSGDLLAAGRWRTALFHAAALAAVARICGICRHIGYIL